MPYERKRCPTCGDLLKRRILHHIGGIEEIRWYCYPCENAALHRLARLAGKI